MVEAFKTQGKGGFFGSSKEVSKVAVKIDFPRERDMVSLGHYAIRMSGNPGSTGEISINGGSWQNCRFSNGHYWFDWNPVKTGTYKLVGRIRKGAQEWETSGERICVVVVPSSR